MGDFYDNCNINMPSDDDKNAHGRLSGSKFYNIHNICLQCNS